MSRFEQEELYAFSVVGIKLQIDVGVLARISGEHRTGEIRVEALEIAHDVEGVASKLLQPFALDVARVESLIGANGGVDFVVVR